MMLNQELRVTVARKELNILLGRDTATPVAVDKDEAIEILDFNLSDLLALAEERNSYLLFVRQNKLVADETVNQARSVFYPRLALNGSYGYTDSETAREVSDGESFFPETIESLNKDAAIGLNLTFNIFRGFRDKIDLQNAKIDARNQQLALDDARNRIVGSVQEKYETYEKQLQLVKLEERNVVTAQQNLDLQLERYNIGTASSLEFRDAQVNLIIAQSALIASRYQSRTTKLEIEQLTGKIQIN
jgi:outer membrane protein TolC